MKQQRWVVSRKRLEPVAKIPRFRRSEIEIEQLVQPELFVEEQVTINGDLFNVFVPVSRRGFREMREAIVVFGGDRIRIELLQVIVIIALAPPRPEANAQLLNSAPINIGRKSCQFLLRTLTDDAVNFRSIERHAKLILKFRHSIGRSRTGKSLSFHE
jgi:hypothetical protein